MPPTVEILTKQMNYKYLQKPDKRGKPNVAVPKAQPRLVDSTSVMDNTDYVFANESFKNEPVSAKQKMPIKATNVSRSPYEDPNLMSMANKISEVKRADKPNGQVKVESLLRDQKMSGTNEKGKAMPLKESKVGAPLKGNTVKSINSIRKVEVERFSNVRDKSPVVRATPTKDKSPVVRSKSPILIKSGNGVKAIRPGK